MSVKQQPLLMQQQFFQTLRIYILNLLFSSQFRPDIAIQNILLSVVYLIKTLL